MYKNNNKFVQAVLLLIVLISVACFAGLAIYRGENINSIWLIIAALCTYTLGYRFYSGFIAAKVLTLDATRATPAERLKDNHDYIPMNRWVVFGHHFAAIAGAGPLIGPTLAAQYGFLPGTLWILIGAVLGGCVQDFIILFFSIRRNGRSLGQMVREELGPIAGIAALIGVLMIIIIIIAVSGLIIVNAMKFSPWATSTVAATIPIAILIGIYMRFLRPGRVLEGTVIGVILLFLSVWGGSMIYHSPTINEWFNYSAPTIALMIIAYGFIATVLPVWLLLAPRDYLSTFLKISVILVLALGIILLRPELKMPAFTQFIDGTGPVFAGKLIPFVFITIACGAVSGFHALIASGTTPKILSNEKDARLVGYGAMLMESFVALIAMIAATILDPGIYFAINSPAGIVGVDPAQAVATISSWGFPVNAQEMQHLADTVGEKTLYSRVGGAPSLAIGMASILSLAFENVLAFWYHFAIMFEAVFILTLLDAGTRTARFMLQDLLGNFHPIWCRTQWMPGVYITSALIVIAWGYFLYTGTLDPLGGINSLWPLFGIANQMLAAIAFCLGTTILFKSKKYQYLWVTIIPLIWLVIMTSWAALEKLFSADIRVGFLAHANHLLTQLEAGTLTPELIAQVPRLVFNDRLDAALTALFLLINWLTILETIRICYKVVMNKPHPPLLETPYVRTQLS